MKTTKFAFAILLFFATFSLNNLNIFAQNETKKLFDIGIETNFITSERLYDFDSEMRIDDTLRIIYKDTNNQDSAKKYQYTTSFSKQIYTLKVGYLGLKNFEIYAKIPFAYYNILEKMQYDENLRRQELSSDSKFKVEGFELNGNYVFDFNKVRVGLLGDLFIPFYKYENPTENFSTTINFDDTLALLNLLEKEISLGRDFEATFGTKFDFIFEPVKLSLSGFYNFRGGDFSDRLLLDFFIGLSNIPNTELYANVRYVNSLGKYEEKFKVNSWSSVLWEKSIEINPGFKIFLTEQLYANIGYSLVVWGKNALGLSIVKANLGYVF
jgi:hypothetical protein